jgi:hypothetical protein
MKQMKTDLHRVVGRSLEKRVGPDVATQFRLVATALHALSPNGRVSKIYIREICEAIDVGLVLSAMTLSMALLEIWLRDLLVLEISKRTGKDLASVDRDVESGKRFLFDKIIDALMSYEVLNSTECEFLKNQYKKFRIPLHHGISGRLLDGEQPFDFGGDLGLAISSPKNRANDFEDFAFLECLEIMREVVNFLGRHQIG